MHMHCAESITQILVKKKKLPVSGKMAFHPCLQTMRSWMRGRISATLPLLVPSTSWNMIPQSLAVIQKVESICLLPSLGRYHYNPPCHMREGSPMGQNHIIQPLTLHTHLQPLTNV